MTTKDIWNSRYSTKDYAFGTAPNDFLQEAVSLLSTEAVSLPNSGRQQPRVLVLADGEGRNGVFLAQQGYAVTSVDYALEGVNKAHALASRHNVAINILHADLCTFEIIPESWDMVVCIFFHPPVPVRQDVYRRAANGLKKGGVFILECYHPRQITYGTGGPPAAELMSTRETATTELGGKTAFTWHICREQDREIQEGRLHNGMSAVVQLLGSKQ